VEPALQNFPEHIVIDPVNIDDKDIGIFVWTDLHQRRNILLIDHSFDNVNIPDAAVNHLPALPYRDRVTVDHNSAVASPQGEPGRAILKTVRRADLEKKSVAMKKLRAKIVDYTVFTKLAKSRKLPCSRIEGV
jgi:hypothetical protein